MISAVRLRQKIVSGELDLQVEVDKLFETAYEENARLNCFITLTSDFARQATHILEEKLTSDKKPGRLFGLPIAIKDNICLRDYPTTCGSKMLADFIPPYNATVVEKLIAEDAVIVAKTNLDEFGMGSSNENSAFGLVRNSHDIERTPGGSSGGSAVAVAAGLTPLALGSDTGGSVRQPAAFCGVVGLKPTYGAVSRYGLVAFASSMDQIGAFAADVQSAALLFDVISGYDMYDSTSTRFDKPGYLAEMKKDINGLKIGLPKEYFSEGLDSEVRDAIETVIDKLKLDGIEVQEVELPYTKYAIATYHTIANAEASSNLARYDGVKYGLRKEADSLTDMYTLSRQAGFGAEVKRRIMLGTYVLSAGYYEAYYQKAQQVRELLTSDFTTAFDKVDLLLTPTTPTTAFKLGEKIGNPLTMYLSDVYTVSVNLAGLPAISIPCGNDSNNLPIGLQLIGKHFDETTLFRAGRAIERLVE